MKQTTTTTDQTQPLNGMEQLLNDPFYGPLCSKYTDRKTYAETLKPMEDCWSMPPEIYTDDIFFKVEQEKVFKQAWVAVAHSSGQLCNDGDILSTHIGKTPIIISKYRGNLKAFYNICRHRGSILLKEGKYSNCTVIRCPYHSWGYSCSGKLMGAPYFNDSKMPANDVQKDDPTMKNEMFAFSKINFNRDEYGLFEIGIKDFMGTLFVNLDSNIERRESSFAFQFGDLNEHYGYYPFDDMRIIDTFEYTIESNWKMIAENFIEYYHLPWVHPELCQVSSVANHIRRQGTGQYCGFGTYPLSYGNTIADPDQFDTFRGLNSVDSEASWFIQVFPNISYFIFPHHIVSLITYPESPGVTNEKMTLLMDQNIKNKLDGRCSLDDDRKEVYDKVEKLKDFYDMVNKQDIKAVELVQKGMQCNSVYRGGRLSAKFEETIYRYQHILIDYLTDEYCKEYPGDSDFVKSEMIKK